MKLPVESFVFIFYSVEVIIYLNRIQNDNVSQSYEMGSENVSEWSEMVNHLKKCPGMVRNK